MHLLLRSALVALTLAAAPLHAQAPTAAADDVRAVVRRMFEGMRTADSAMVRSVFASGARFAMIDSRATPPVIKYDAPDGWLAAIANSARRWEERLYDVEVRVDGHMAQVWAPYTFYVDGKVRHCGVDTMELLRDASGAWRVTQLSDTQRREGCRDVPAS